MQPKHTPGPWRQDTSRHERSRERTIILGADGLKVADCETRCEDGIKFIRTFAEDAANARLIAAAPDFYTACTHERDTVNRVTWLSALVNLVDANLGSLAVEDREAVYTALQESAALVDALRAAIAKAEGGSDVA